ncbi:MAG TPA: hypothetical protein VH915_08690 [Pedococcus sp.]
MSAPDWPAQLRRLDEAMSAATMAPRLTAALGRPGPCHLLDAKVEPGVRAELLYEHAGRLVRGDLLAPGDDGHGDGPDGLVVEPGVRLAPFPHDPDLPTLRAACDPDVLGPAVAAALGRPTRGRPSVRLLRYRPAKRVTLLLRDAGTAHVAKVYHQPHKAAAVAEEAPRLLASLGAGPLALAPTVASLPELAVVVQEQVAGVPLDALLGARGVAGPGLWHGLDLAGAALAAFHALPVVSARSRPVEAELVRFTGRASRVALLDPALGAALTELAARLTEAHDRLPAARVGTVHGDCKPGQFLLGPTRTHLLDLDHCGTADQAVDAGTFLATLRQLATRQSLAGRLRPGTTVYAAAGDRFLAAYLRARGSAREVPRIRWHEAVALERKALRAFARAPRSPLAAALADEATRCLDHLEEAA